MENRSHALLAGIFVVMLGCAALAALWWLGQGNADMARYVLETRKNVTGLNVQAQVRFRGIRAGKVESIEPDARDPQLILVTILLDRRFTVSQGATAHLGYQGVTGLAYVQIEDDGSSRDVLLGKDGEPPRIAMRDGLFEGLGERAGHIMTQLGTTSERLNQLLDERNLKNIARTLDNVAVGSEGLRELPKVMASLREMFSPQNVERWQRLVAHVEATAGVAAPLTAEVRQLVASLTELSHRANGLVQSAEVAGAHLSATTLPQTEQMLRELHGSARHLSHVLEGIERNPQMLLFGRSAPTPGPGERGFSAAAPSR